MPEKEKWRVWSFAMGLEEGRWMSEGKHLGSRGTRTRGREILERDPRVRSERPRFGGELLAR